MSGIKTKGTHITLSFFFLVIVSWFFRFYLLYKNYFCLLAIICITMLCIVYYIHSKKFNIYNLRDEINKIIK
jgi:hypothetical protein